MIIHFYYPNNALKESLMEPESFKSLTTPIPLESPPGVHR